jgi:hypothetical protein
MQDTFHGGINICPATLLPYPVKQEPGPVALRPVFSDGLPLSDITYAGSHMVIHKKVTGTVTENCSKHKQ